MIRKHILAAVLVVFGPAASVLAQPSMTGRVLFQIRAEAIDAFRQAFEPFVSSDKNFDPQRCTVTNEDQIRALLAIPSSISHLSLKPFLAQHNIALEALRERTNPGLFANMANSIRPESDELAMLRTSEEHLSRWFEICFDKHIPVGTVLTLLKKNHLIEAAEARYIYPLQFSPNDSLYTHGKQYSISMMNANAAWDIVRCDSTMLVADDDIGADWTHEDLSNAVFINAGETGLDANGVDKRYNGIDDDGDGFIDDWHGWDFAGTDGSSPDNNPTAAQVHGTHTSGIMAASGNNKIGICGIAFGAKVLVLKCGDDYGQNVAFGYEGMIYAADMGAKVVNNSWGGNGYSQVAQDIINYATSKNCAVVAAAGNYSVFEDLYPASYDHVLSVAAIDSFATYAGFSDFGTHVDVSAPGAGVISTVPDNGYESLDGTSMASPNAAGALALVRQRFPNLNPDQAIERLRVTALQLASNPHPGFTGSGIVQIDKALSTATSLHSVRMISVTNDNGSILSSGEHVNLVVTAKNYLDPVQALKATLEFVDPSDSDIVSFRTNVIDFGDAATLQAVQNLSSLPISIAAAAPSDKTVLIRVKFFSTPSQYGPDIDYFTLTINPSYLDLDSNHIRTTVSARGDLAYNDPPNNSQGSGFLWSAPPTSIAVTGRNVLFQGGLMIGTGPEHIVAAAPSAFSDNSADQDYTVTKPAHYVLPPDHVLASQEIVCSYSDTVPATTDPFGDSLKQAKEVGVSIVSSNYEFNDGAALNSAVMSFLVTRRPYESNIFYTDQTAAGLYMDWDIGSSGANNVASVSPLDPDIVVVRRNDPDFPFVGMKIVSDIPAGASTNLYALNNDGSGGSVGVYNGFVQSDKWLTLTTPRATAGPNDVSVVYGLKNIPLHSRDSITLTYILALGSDNADLKRTIDRTEVLWKTTSSVRTNSSVNTSLVCFPNPFTDMIHMHWDVSEKATLRIIDVLGRTVESVSATGTSAMLDLSSLPRGTYYVLVETLDATMLRQIVKQ